MLFNVAPGELFIIGLVLLLVVGPEQLPTVARNVGRTLRRVRDMSLALKADFMASIDEPILGDKPNSSTEYTEPSTFLDNQTQTEPSGASEIAGDTESSEPESNDTPAEPHSDEVEPDPPTDGVLP